MDELALLKTLDLTEYESRVFLSLARLGPAPVRRIVEHSKVPKNKAYETLERLHERGFVKILPVSPRQYMIESFGKLHDLVKRKQEELEQTTTQLEELEKFLGKGAQEYKEFFWVIKGQKAIQEKLRSENERAATEVLSVNTLSQQLPGNMRSARNSIQRGVEVRFLCPLTKENRANVLQWASTGTHIRILSKSQIGTTIPRFTVFDKKTVRITIGKPEIKSTQDYLSLWTQSPVLAQVFRQQFLAMWKKAIPLEKALK